MSVPGILYNIGLGLAGTNQSETRHTLKQGKQDFEQLLDAIQKGDLGAAQQALSGLQQLQPGLRAGAQEAVAPAADSGATANGAQPLATDFATLGASLRSGNLDGAQDAFAKLQQDFRSLHQQNSQYGSLGRAAEVHAVLQQLGVTGPTGSAAANVSSFVSTLDKIKGDAGALQQALQSGNPSLSQDALARLLQDLHASSGLPGRNATASGAALLASA
ncbi:MAG: hypothetical protein HY777_12090 [Betaproteobacteria bacterium]|nr:hypothetical protein [Betaproteobacteria bacterium]